MNDHAGSETTAKRQILVHLSSALSALSDRMRAQGSAAAKITFLAVRAEKIAQRSWDLNTGKNANFRRDTQALMADVKALAQEASDAATRAGEEALLGREVANAIAAHSEDVAKLAREIDGLPDSASVRSRLRPLSITLSTLPERLKANAAAIRDINSVAGLASGLAERGDRLGAGGIAANEEAVALCRDLRRFAEEATVVSLELSRGSALAVQSIDNMAKITVGLSLGKPVADAPVTAHDRMMALARAASPATPAAVSATSKTDNKPAAAAMVWGTTPVRKV